MDTTYDEAGDIIRAPWKARRAFVNEAYGTASAMESVALKAAIVLPIHKS